MQSLRVGISTCPNDTYAFHALLSGAVRAEGVELVLQLGDIEELNQALLDGRLDIAKSSYAIALAQGAAWLALPVGSALGYGVGPIVLAPPESIATPGTAAHVLLPGEHTTATLLYRMLHGRSAREEQLHFAEIIPRLQQAKADLGVCIHEARFTWQAQGLRWVEDLGEGYVARSQAPLPLGGLCARRGLEPAALDACVTAVRRSLAYARRQPEQALVSMRHYAQEYADEVLWQHVELYVNETTFDLGQAGRQALQVFADQVRASGLIPRSTPALEVWRTPSPLGADTSPDGRRARLFHCVRRSQWEGEWAKGTLPYQPASYTREGFLHLSFAEQVRGSLDRHFQDVDEAYCVELYAATLAGHVLLEPSRAGALFPHLYRPLRQSDIRGVRRWQRTQGGWIELQA